MSILHVYIQSNILLYNISNYYGSIKKFEVYYIFQSILINGPKNNKFNILKEDIISVSSNGT